MNYRYMNEFENKLIIKEEAYQRNYFRPLPKFDKRGSAFLFTGGSSNDIIVNENTTTKEVRKGRYTKLVEISTLPYLKEIRFHSPSKESAYSFDVYVKAVIQVVDPILFYQNKNIDVDAYFDNLFSLDVRKVTKGYSILDYDGMDDTLTQKLSSYNTIDETTGFNYRISVVDATPGEKARQYVDQYSKQLLDAGLKNNARKLSSTYSTIYEDAVMTEVAEGKLTESDAILKIEEYKTMNFENQVKRLEELREKDLITNKEAKNLLNPALDGVGIKNKLDANLESGSSKKIEMDDFYTGEEE